MSFPSSELEVSKREKKESISSVAEIVEVRKLETRVRNSESLIGSLRRRLDARSITAAWRVWRARSWGVVGAAGSVSRRLRFANSRAGGEDRAGAAAFRSGARTVWVSLRVSWPPKLRVETDCALWMATCLW